MTSITNLRVLLTKVCVTSLHQTLLNISTGYLSTWALICLVRWDWKLYEEPQTVHLKFFLFSCWVFMCIFREPWNEYVFPQSPQMYGFSPVCFLRWFCNSVLTGNGFSQNWHTYLHNSGKWCFFLWTYNKYVYLKSFPHNLQMYPFLPSCTDRLCINMALSRLKVLLHSGQVRWATFFPGFLGFTYVFPDFNFRWTDLSCR